jgi:hypothetical protein
MLGGPQSRSGCGGEEKNFQPLPGLEPPIIQLVAQRYTAELTRLFLSGNGQKQIKIAFTKKLKEDNIRAMTAAILFRIFCLPVSFLRT